MQASATDIRLILHRRVRGIRLCERFEGDDHASIADVKASADGVDFSAMASREQELEDKISFLEQELQRAREESFQAGYEEGQQVGESDARVRIEGFDQQVIALKMQYDQVLENLEKPVISLAREMAARIIDSELASLDDHRPWLQGRLQRLMYDVIDQQRVAIELNPGQVHLFEDGNFKADMGLPRQMEISILASPHLKPGDCRISSDEFQIDGTVDGQLGHLEDQLREDD